MKTCNGGYCGYKIQAGCEWGCTYEGYCDYQTPRDSRPLINTSLPFPPQCTCGTGSSLPCPMHQPNG